VDYLLHHLLRSSVERDPHQEAIVHAARRQSYVEMVRETTQIAAGLREAGLQRGDRAGVLLEPSVPLANALFAISQAGGAFVPIHHSLFPDQVEHIVNDCQMKGVVTDAARFQKLRTTLEKCPSLQFVILVGGDAQADTTLRTYSYEKFCQGDWQTLADLAIEKDLAAILYTSGSTGKPKGVMLSHANVMAGASIVATYLNITAAERILAVLPFSFDAGLNQLTTAMLRGATCVVMKFLFAREIVAMAAKEQVTGLAGVPPLWSLIAQDSSKLRDTPLPHLRYITNTGGAMPLNILDKLRAAVPQTRVFLMYGLTEAFRSTYLPPEELDRRPTSMGKAIPNTEIILVDENGRRCGPGETGELIHRGPTVSLGYWGQPELTDKVLRPNPFMPLEMRDTEKVCYSGDLVRMDEDGFLYFVGRRDNQIKSSGFRISPTEVEEALFKAGQLRHAAVIGLPDDMLGQRIKAFVVPQDGTTVDADDLLERVTELLPRHMVPKSVEVVTTLPTTASGKIDYPELRKREYAALGIA
jgi:acyl-CoA ligase (AMP-forming) (exosortase A-associated)